MITSGLTQGYQREPESPMHGKHRGSQTRPAPPDLHVLGRAISTRQCQPGCRERKLVISGDWRHPGTPTPRGRRSRSSPTGCAPLTKAA
jgi:hypothetical protein